MGAFEATARECRVELTPPIGAELTQGIILITALAGDNTDMNYGCGISRN